MKKLFMEDEKIAYYVTDDGKVFSLRKKSGKWRELKPIKDKNGYALFISCLDGKKKHNRIHRVVWEVFRGNIPSDMEINHINCIRDDNRLDNLELVTHSQNLNHPLSVEHFREAATKQFQDIRQRQLQRERKRRMMKPVLDATTGRVYESTHDAARKTGLRQGHISECCLGKRKQEGGHIFRYAS